MEILEKALSGKIDFDSLPDDIKKEVDRQILIERLAELKKQALTPKKYNYNELKEAYLSGYKGNTLKAYKRAFTEVEAYCQRQGIENVLYFDYDTADSFINELKTRPREMTCGKERSRPYSAKSVRMITIVLCSFFKGLQRRTGDELKNPFRNSPELPKIKHDPYLESKDFYPTLSDLNRILKRIKEADEIKGLLFELLSITGLRVGTLCTMERIKPRTYRAVSKGKPLLIRLDDEAMEIIRSTGLKGPKPFEAYTANVLECYFAHYTRQLAKEGEIYKAYSVHTLRHYYAARMYSKTKDIYKVSRLLNHSSVKITEIYLQGINVLNNE